MAGDVEPVAWGNENAATLPPEPEAGEPEELGDLLLLLARQGPAGRA